MEIKIKAFLIFFALGVLPVNAERYSSGGEALFVGALQGLFFMFIFWIWRIFKGRKSKTKETTKETNLSRVTNIPKPQPTPWEKYKKENCEVAQAIEQLAEEDMGHLSEKSISEKVAIFKRIATHYNCSILEVKEMTIKELLSKFDDEELLIVSERLTEKAENESRKYCVAKENTMAYYTKKWLNEYMQNNQQSRNG